MAKTPIRVAVTGALDQLVEEQQEADEDDIVELEKGEEAEDEEVIDEAQEE
jgi:hypothetical protein